MANTSKSQEDLAKLESGESGLKDDGSVADIDLEDMDIDTAPKSIDTKFFDENPERQSKSKDTVGSNEALLGDQLLEMTHQAVGEPDRPLMCLPLVAAKPRSSWLEDLDSTGYAGLLFADMTSMDGQPGYFLSWWFENRQLLRRRLVKTPLDEKASAGVFTLKSTLPNESLVSSVMCTVAELVGSNKSCKYAVSTAQLFLPSSGGFSQDFRHEETSREASLEGFRCFWFFGPGKEDRNKIDFSLVTTPEREYMFIGSGGDETKVFGTHRVVTLTGFFGEADRKFRLHPGDILVLNARYPFAVDLPIGGRAKGARVLSWLILPKTESTKFPIVMPNSELLMSIDMLISTDKEALDYRTQEFEQFEVHPGSPGDPEGHMQRLRVTPAKYTRKEIMKEVENNPRIMYLDNAYFDDKAE